MNVHSAVCPSHSTADAGRVDTHPLHDPTGTASLRASFRAAHDRRWMRVRQLASASVASADPLLHVAHADRVSAFNAWLDDVMRTVVMGGGAWMAPYLHTAFAMARKRAGRLIQTQDY